MTDLQVRGSVVTVRNWSDTMVGSEPFERAMLLISNETLLS